MFLIQSCAHTGTRKQPIIQDKLHTGAGSYNRSSWEVETGSWEVQGHLQTQEVQGQSPASENKDQTTNKKMAENTEGPLAGNMESKDCLPWYYSFNPISSYASTQSSKSEKENTARFYLHFSLSKSRRPTNSRKQPKGREERKNHASFDN